MSRYKCTCKSCCMNINGECKLSATQVFNMGCSEFIKKEAEYVDFAQALKAYRNSATIKSVTGEKYSLKREDEGLCVNLKEIEGKWLILEDE